MRRLGASFAIASLVVLGAMVGCSLLTGLGDRPSYAVDGGGAGDAGADSTSVRDGTTAEASDAQDEGPCFDDAACDAHCGVLLNRCGVVVACGNCGTGKTCGAPTTSSPNGTPNVCGIGACTPSCAAGQAMFSCGYTNGCDGICTAGTCDSPGLACAGGICKCSPGSCAGCCGDDGQCHSGVGGPGGCGSGGVHCQESTAYDCDASTCGGNGQPCCASGPSCQSPLACLGGGLDGGADGGSGGGRCGCVPSCADAGCGASDGCGGICQGATATCAPGQVCANGGVCVCDPTQCSGGCCNGTTCEVNPGDAGLCGIGGNVCQPIQSGMCPHCGGYAETCCPGTGCTPPLSCEAGEAGKALCVGCTPSCVAKLCGQDDGCGHPCFSDGPNASPQAIACPIGEHCGVASGAVACVCDSTSCAEGCCVGGACVNGNVGNPALCGIGGGQCIACGAGQICSGGLCQTPADP